MSVTKTRQPNSAAARKPAAVPKADGPRSPVQPVTGVVMGVLTGLTEDLTALVSFEGNPAQGAIRARALASLGQDDIGKVVALQFEQGDITQPVIIGLLYRAAKQSDGPFDGPLLTSAPGETIVSLLASHPLQVIANGHEVTLIASRKLTLQCGRASISLDVDGNIELRGQDLLSRAAGQNRIKGSSISLN